VAAVKQRGTRTGVAGRVLRTDREHLFLMALHSWGEPLLNKHVPSFVRKAKAREIEVHTHTNLSLRLADEWVDELVGSGLDILFASVDGFSQEAYERFRVGGDVELVKENLRRLAAARDRLGVPTVIVYKFLVFRWNEHEVAEARRFSEEHGLHFEAQDAAIPDASWLPSHREGEQPFLSAADVEDLDRQWAAAGHPDYWKDHERHAYWIPVQPGNRWIPTDGPQTGSFCGWLYSTPVTQPGGHVTPCCVTSKAHDRFGRVVPGETSLQDVWNGAPYRKSRAAFTGAEPADLQGTDTVCTRCYFPDPLKQLYNNNDFKVIGQYQHVLGGADPVLDQAFQLLASGEAEDNRRRYVEFFEANLVGRV
jgi:MoaA/NifB/PqqE/SkfB family radical SAM enzyme